MGACYSWRRNQPTYMLSPHFSTGEFACPCGKCDEQIIAIDLVAKLEQVRVAMKRPIKVTSGYRCAAHQAELAARGYETAIGISQHQIGNAADIVLPGATLADFMTMLQECEKHFLAIGEGLSFLHVDLRVDKMRRWYYGVRK